jgi:hypothetical protein
LLFPLIDIESTDPGIFFQLVPAGCQLTPMTSMLLLFADFSRRGILCPTGSFPILELLDEIFVGSNKDESRWLLSISMTATFCSPP